MAQIKVKFNRGVEGATNIVDAGTEGTKVASGTTAQRGSTAGQFRFNSTTGKFEGRNASSFISIETSPVVSSVNTTNITQAQIDAGFDLVITGQNFASGDTVNFVGNDNTEYTSPTVTIDSATQITARVTSTIDATKEPFKITVQSSGGLTGSLASAFNIDASPVFGTASGSLGTVYDSVRSSTTLTASATDSEGDTITYSVQSGSLPAGASLNSSTGAITGFSAVGSDTVSNFTIRATSGTNTSDRAYSITVKAPVVDAFTYTGATQTFTVPTGITSVVAKVWGGAGAGHGEYYNCNGGAGGFGIGTINLTGITSLNIVVGQGGQERNTPSSGRVGEGTPSANKISTYGHLVNHSNGEAGGWGNNGGTGGGLSGIFNGAVTSQSNAIVIAGGGGASGSVQGGGCGNSSGGYGGGFNQNGGDGNPNHDGAHGRGGTTSAGGNNGNQYYVRSSGNNGTNGIALAGGHGNVLTSGSSEGGGGGSGYYGGGAGSHGSPGGSWGSAGGGSGYADTSIVSSITASNAGSAGATNTTATSDSNWVSGIGVPVAGDNDGGHGRVVLIY